MLVTQALKGVALALEVDWSVLGLAGEDLDRYLTVDVPEVKRLVYGRQSLLQRTVDDVVSPVDGLHARNISHFLSPDIRWRVQQARGLAIRQHPLDLCFRVRVLHKADPENADRRL